MNLDLVIAILLGLAGLSAGFRQIILSPSNASFPKASGLVRAAMFLYAMALAGGAVLFWGASQSAGDYAGMATFPVAYFCAGMAFYNVVMLHNLMSQRYEPVLWQRINRVTDTVKASCPERRRVTWNPF